jgi:hypothetical protein
VRIIEIIDKHIKKGDIRCDNNELLDLMDWKRNNDEKLFGENNTYKKMLVWDEYISMR